MDGTPPAEGLFWEEAIGRVRDRHPDFLFMAEVYWGLEWALQQQGFSYTYDKALYDRLHAGNGRPVREHLMADHEYQVHSARFLENHDEPRAAEAFSPEMHRAAAIITFFVPGLRFFHEGEFDGRRVHVSMHLNRRPAEPVDAAIRQFYDGLLESLQRPETHDGQWRLWSCRPAWDGNGTWDQFIVFTWEGRDGQRLLGAVNYGPNQGQCYVTLDIPDLAGHEYQLRDVTGETVYQRSGDGLTGNGLYLDMPPWGYHLFDLVEEKAVSRAAA